MNVKAVAGRHRGFSSSKGSRNCSFSLQSTSAARTRYSRALSTRPAWGGLGFQSCQSPTHVLLLFLAGCY